MSELTFGMRLTYSGSEANAALEQTRAKVDAISTSSERLARQNAMMGQTFKQSSTEIKDTEASVRRLLDRYDPLGAKLRQLQDDFKKLDAAAAGGKIAGRDDVRVDQVYANLQKQIAAASAATDGYAAANGKAALSAGQLRVATQQLPMQFTDIWVSLAAGQSPMMVMLQQGTQIKDSFGGVGNAARAMGGYIMGLINPVTAVTGVVAAGAAAWYYWGSSAEEAAKKAIAGLDDVRKKADEAQRYTKQQQLQQLTFQIQSAELDAQWQAGLAANTQKSNEIRSIAAKTAGEYRRLAEGLRQQKADLEKQIADENKPKSSKEDTRTQAEKDFADAWVQTQQLLQNTDPQAKANAEWERMIYLQETLGKEVFPLTAEQMGQAYARSMAGIVKETDKAAAGMSETWKTFRDSTQRVLGDQLFDAMMGKFNSLEDAFKQMLFRMAANAASARLTEAMFGTGTGGDTGWMGGLMKAFGFADGGAFGVHAFANGGTFSNGLYTQPTPFKFANGGGFSLGVMGEAGPEAVMPLSRDSSGKLGVRAQGGGGTTVVIQDHTTINVDSRADRAQVLSDVSRLIDSRQGQLVERLRREKAIA